MGKVASADMVMSSHTKCMAPPIVLSCSMISPGSVPSMLSAIGFTLEIGTTSYVVESPIVLGSITS